MNTPQRFVCLASLFGAALLVGCGSGSSSRDRATSAAPLTSSGTSTSSSGSLSPSTSGGLATASTQTLGTPSGLRLDTVTPNTGPLRGGVVTLEGQEFEAGMSVDFDGEPGLDLTVISPTQATVRVPVLQLGQANVTVAKATEVSSLVAAYDVRPDRVGELDPTFGVGGVTRVVTKATPAGAYVVDRLVASALDSQGRILAVGGINTNEPNRLRMDRVAVVRFLANGALDTTFGAGGRVTLPWRNRTGFPNPTAESAQGIAVDSADRALVAITGFQGADARHIVVRLTATGALDTTYGVNGIARRELRTSRASGIAIDSGDRLLVSGTVVPAGTSIYRPAVWRYTANGQLDATFGTGGARVLPANSGQTFEPRIDPQGKIVLVGWHFLGGVENDGVVYRLTSAGALDPTFGAGGRVILDLSVAQQSSLGVVSTDYVEEVAFDSQGRLVLLAQQGTGVNRYSLRRLLPNGAVDATFGQAGQVPLVGRYHGLAIGAGDRILTASSEAPAGGTRGMSVHQFDDAGNPDPTFAAGKPYFHLPLAGRQEPRGLLLDGEGRALVVGGGVGPADIAHLLIRVR